MPLKGLLSAYLRSILGPVSTDPDFDIGYPAAQQFLVLGVRLEDGRTLADYSIQSNTVLHMRLVGSAARLKHAILFPGPQAC